LGRIIIPRLGIDAPIVKVAWHIEQIEGQALAVWDVAVNAVGHHSGTSPLGGEGNCPRRPRGMFRALDQAQVGDEIFLRWGEASERAYLVEEVTQVAEVGASLADRLANAECMAATDEARLTLITCWPDWAYTHRLIVVARPR
jgi:LPXTG-site transpeptidase (sortase) family protein